jgi:hypothetical protein
MHGSLEDDHYSGEEVFMAFLLVVLVPVMLLAANLDLRSQVAEALQQFSRSASIRIWIGQPELMEANVSTEALSSSEAPRETTTPLAAFGVQDSTSAVPSRATVAEDRKLSIMALNFSLSQFSGSSARLPAHSDGPLTVKKRVYAGSRLIGDLDITVAGEGELLLEAGDVRAVVGEQAGPGSGTPSRLPEQGLVSFASLREMGIDLRYSPTDDAIMINP